MVDLNDRPTATRTPETVHRRWWNLYLLGDAQTAYGSFWPTNRIAMRAAAGFLALVTYAADEDFELVEMGDGQLVPVEATQGFRASGLQAGCQNSSTDRKI